MKSWIKNLKIYKWHDMNYHEVNNEGIIIHQNGFDETSLLYFSVNIDDYEVNDGELLEYNFRNFLRDDDELDLIYKKLY